MPRFHLLLKSFLVLCLCYSLLFHSHRSQSAETPQQSKSRPGADSRDGNDMILPDLRQMRTMNGIDPKHFHEFWKTWPLVTVRYRPDKGEQRFVYANPIAYNALKEGLLDLPDGSAFGKVAYLTAEDPQFPNSVEPSDYTRVQLMVKDSKRFQKLDGWSYWLHTDSGKVLQSEDKSRALACHACHRLVKDRDFIFSAPTFLQKRASWYGKIGKSFKDRFRKKKISQLSSFEKSILDLLPQAPQTVHRLRMRLFTGSLYESIGPVSRFASQDSPYLLVDPIAKRFLIATRLESTSKCKSHVLIFADRRKILTRNGNTSTQRYLGKGIVCNGKNHWEKSEELPKALRLKS